MHDSAASNQLLIPVVVLCVRRLFVVVAVKMRTTYNNIIARIVVIYCCLIYLGAKCDHTPRLRILAAFSHPGQSHGDSFKRLLESLAHRGHHVTILSFYPHLFAQHENITNIELQSDFVMVSVADMERTFYSNIRLRQYAALPRLSENADIACKKAYESQHMRQFLAKHTSRESPSPGSSQKFDLLLMEFFNSDCLAKLANVFNVPIIGLSSCTILSWTNRRFGNPNNPSYIPNNILYFSDKMTFLERVENTLLTIIQDIVVARWRYMRDIELVDRLIGGGSSIEQAIANNLSLILVNSHWSINGPRPLVPGVVEVAGMHLDHSVHRKISPNIERWLNEAREGVIFFSMGSMIKGHTFPADKRQAFLKAFSRFPEHRVLWKWENDTMDGERQPLPNVMLQRWMPQFDILCHPNVKAFISHGGLLSTIEAVHCGVPVVIMPQFGDQFTNARALEANGGGLTLHLADADESSIYDALLAALSPKLQLSSHQLSERFRDRPLPPLDTAIYWVEYVARHKGAYHMRTAAVNMPLYQYLLLDVLAFVIVVFMIISIVCIYITKWLWRKIFASREQNTKKKSS